MFDVLFEVRHLAELHKFYDKFKYIHDTKSAQIAEEWWV